MGSSTSGTAIKSSKATNAKEEGKGWLRVNLMSLWEHELHKGRQESRKNIFKKLN